MEASQGKFTGRVARLGLLSYVMTRAVPPIQGYERSSHEKGSLLGDPILNLGLVIRVKFARIKDPHQLKNGIRPGSDP